MDLNEIHHIFKLIVDDFNLEDGQNRGLHLSYHIFSGVIDSVVYELEITILDSRKKCPSPVIFYQKIIPNQKF